MMRANLARWVGCESPVLPRLDWSIHPQRGQEKHFHLAIKNQFPETKTCDVKHDYFFERIDDGALHSSTFGSHHCHGD